MDKKQHPLEATFARLQQFWLFESKNTYYLVGFDDAQTAFRLIKLNRTIEQPKSLDDVLRLDPLIYTSIEIQDILDMVNEGNKTNGGLLKVCHAYGIVGFVKFLNGYYLSLITQRKEVGCIAGNFIYTIKATEIFAIRPKDEPESNAFRFMWKKLNKKLSQTTSEVAENRYLGLFQFIDMTKDFFFSYSYDLTQSMQLNYVTTKGGRVVEVQDMFEWNHHQIDEMRSILGPSAALAWTIPIIHGSYQQKRFSLFGKSLDLILIARRSRFFAGTRYLKRGISVHGKVANDVEVEQIIQYDGGPEVNFCSYVQMRGSIPTFWYQETSVTMPKPPIMLSRMDPDYLATQEHFADLFRRYNSPILVLDLVKQHEKRPRESIVGREFRHAIETLNESIPVAHQIRYIALDYSKITSISKGKLSRAKAAPGNNTGFLSSYRPPVAKERAMAAVGQEWAMMEKTFSKNDTTTAAASSLQPVVSGSSSKERKVSGNNNTAADNTITSFSTFDEARRASQGSQTRNTLSAIDNNDHHAYEANLLGGFEDIAEVNALESRIDVLKELEDIATLTLAETSFFCSTIQFSHRMSTVVSPQMIDTAQRQGMFIQSGVLRTNCIDCLDRTNGGQFAVSMRFLSVTFKALGISDDDQNYPLDMGKDPVLVSLMEMYGEMGDKIALQYGGSEAHKKVIAGKSVQSQNSSKQSELLTSIKRYYSNAFTDMVKQDAMNLFLGCFHPLESNVQLWDLESDYLLHNLDLHPPQPKSYRAMFEDIIAESERTRDPVLRSKMETALKKVLLEGSVNTAMSAGGLLSQSGSKTDLTSSASALMVDEVSSERALSPVSSFKTEASAMPTTTTVTGMTAVQSRLAFEHLLRQYYIRQLATPESLIKLKNRGFVSSIARQITRLERRRLVRLVGYTKVHMAMQAWWVDAIRSHLFQLYQEDRRDELMQADAHEGLDDRQTMTTMTYYDRFHQPNTLTEFDTILTLEFFAPVIGVSSGSKQQPTTGIDTMNFEDDEFDRENDSKPDPDGQQPAIRSLVAFFFPPATTQLPPTTTTTAAPQQHSRDIQISQESDSHNSNSFTQRPAMFYRNEQNSSDNNLILSPNNNDDSGSQKAAAAEQTQQPGQGGFQLTRYVREIGLKARNIVGGFLRRDDSAITPSHARRMMKNTLGDTQVSRNASIAVLQNYIPRNSMLIYASYSAIYDRPLLLIENNKLNNHDQILEDEYRLLLKDSIVDANNVRRMEQFAADGYISTEIKTGIYQGMSQLSSAQLADAFLFISLINIESELQVFGQHVEKAAEQSRAKLVTGPDGQLKSVEGGNVSSKSSSKSAPQARTTAPSTSTAGRGGMKANSLEMTNVLNDRITELLNRSTKSVAAGLEMEFRKLVNNYIFQQYNYQKEISVERLAKGISPLTSEKGIMMYSTQFHPEIVASEWEDISYIAKQSSGYVSFRDVQMLQQQLNPSRKRIAEKKTEVLSALKKQASEAAAEEEEIITINKSTLSNKINRSGSSADKLSLKKEKSLTEQLGLHMLGLSEDLSREFTLPTVDKALVQEYESFPFYSPALLAAEEAALTLYPIGHNSRVEMAGFHQLTPDLYSRATNPHLQMNEIGAMRYREVLLRG